MHATWTILMHITTKFRPKCSNVMYAIVTLLSALFQRINLNQTCILNVSLQIMSYGQAGPTNFLNTCVLPEFLGRWYSRPFIKHNQDLTISPPSGSVANNSTASAPSAPGTSSPAYCYSLKMIVK